MPLMAAARSVPHEAVRVLDEHVQDCRCLVVGPGMGKGDGVRALALRAIQQEQAPVVVDADALNALSRSPSWCATSVPRPF
jgi:NAD(P)H-hydrate repair Nnr-like enzyme with NAD(P)H-hydrate dehydratase domain